MIPNWVNTINGRTPSTQNTAAKHDPGTGDDPTGGRDRAHHAVTSPVSGGLLAGAGHQEDGVVHAERDQEQKREKRCAVIQCGKAEYMDAGPAAQPKCGQRG